MVLIIIAWRNIKGEKMTVNNDVMLKIKIGRRFKELIKEFDGKQEITANHLHYSKTSISRFCSGKELLPDSAIEKLANRWGVRKEYLKCEDDYKTHEELFMAACDKNYKRHSIQVRYLESLGFELALKYLLLCPTDVIDHYLDELLPFMYMDADGTTPLYFDFYAIPDDDLLYGILSEAEQEQLTKGGYSWGCLNSVLPDEICNNLGITGVGKHFIDIETDKPFCTVALCYVARYDGKLCGVFNTSHFDRLFDIMDSYTKCSLEMFLNGRFDENRFL